MRIDFAWFIVLSELFVNLSAGWFVVVFIEPQINPPLTVEKLLALIFKLILGILSLVIAKYLREERE